MRIKQPNSNNALDSLWKHIDLARESLLNCVAENHDVISVIYISSYIITPNVVFGGRKLLQEIINLANVSPHSVCSIRTTTPEYFKGYLRTLQKNSLRLLRTKCYVTVFSPQQEFTNHAKFLVHYNICLSEKVAHFGNFYGSTNFTAKGLGNPNKRGNYEEFEDHDGLKHSDRLSNQDKAYLKEILALINHRAWIYTDFQYLTNYVSTHLRILGELLQQEKRSNDRSTLDLYRRYINFATLYNQTLALLDDIPGRKLTQEMIEKLTSAHPPADPSEIEAMSIDTGYEGPLLQDLGLDEIILRDLEEKSRNGLRTASSLIREMYRPAIVTINEHFDEEERSFYEYLRQNHEKQASNLSKIIKSFE